MKKIIALSILFLFSAQQSYSMRDDSKESKSQASASISTTASSQQDEWTQYLQQEHEAHLKTRIFQTAETILRQFGLDPKTVHVVVVKPDEASTWHSQTKTIFISNELGEENANQCLKNWLLYHVDCFAKTVKFLEHNSVAIENLKKTILHINHQVIDDLLNRKEYSAITARLLNLLGKILNGTDRAYPYPTSQEEYNNTLQQLKDNGCTIELTISEQSTTSTCIELKFQNHIIASASVIIVSQNFSLSLAQVYALLYPETYSSALLTSSHVSTTTTSASSSLPESKTASSRSSSSSSTTNSSSTTTTTSSNTATVQNATAILARNEEMKEAPNTGSQISCLPTLVSMFMGGRSQ